MDVKTKYDNVIIKINITNLSYRILQNINGKFKRRRDVIGRPVRTATKGNPKHDNYGNQLFNRFADIEDSKQHAMNYVDNFLKLL